MGDSDNQLHVVTKEGQYLVYESINWSTTHTSIPSPITEFVGIFDISNDVISLAGSNGQIHLINRSNGHQIHSLSNGNGVVIGIISGEESSIISLITYIASSDILLLFMLAFLSAILPIVLEPLTKA